MSGHSAAPRGRSHHAYLSLRERIVTGAVEPGKRLVERDLAAELETSRIPVREALARLAADGLVMVVPGAGTVVNPLGPVEVNELFDLREALEPLAARLAAERREPAALKRLRARLDEAQAVTERVPLIEANAAFHRELIDASGHTLLAQTMLPLEYRLRRLYHRVERDPASQCGAHVVQYEAIAQGDVDRAVELARDHVRAGRAPAVEAVSRKGEPAVDLSATARSRRRRTPGA